MLISVDRIFTNDVNETPFIEARVIFHDLDKKPPYPSADIIIFLEKKEDMTLSEIKSLALQKAEDFLRQILSFH